MKHSKHALSSLTRLTARSLRKPLRDARPTCWVRPQTYHSKTEAAAPAGHPWKHIPIPAADSEHNSSGLTAYTTQEPDEVATPDVEC